MNNGIIQNVSFSHFCDAFRDMGREEQFTYKGKRALFDYLEELAGDTGAPIALDVIALCCEYSEYSDAIEAWRDYHGHDGTQLEGADDEEKEEEAKAFFRDNTQVIEAPGVFIIAQF
jgi:hypothetical protein